MDRLAASEVVSVPLYEFRCKKCDQVFEQVCRMGENGKTVACPKCRARGARRLMSVFSARVSGGSSSKALSGSSCSSCSGGDCAHCH